MFSADSFACSVVTGFFPIYNSPADCTWEFAASMVVGGMASFIFRHQRFAWLTSLFGGIGAYYLSLASATLVLLAIAPPPNNQEQLGWFLFICIFLMPRALLASAAGLLLWEAFFFVKTTRRATQKHG